MAKRTKAIDSIISELESMRRTSEAISQDYGAFPIEGGMTQEDMDREAAYFNGRAEGIRYALGLLKGTCH